MDQIHYGTEFIQELESESAATRKCLERIPENLFSWGPHEKSMKMGRLAQIVAEIPKWLTSMVGRSGLDFASFERSNPRTSVDLVREFDENLKEAKNALKQASNEALSEPFQLKNQGKVLISMPKRIFISSSINHLVHHRGQLTVYMRLNNIAVPSIYGPSADEAAF